jgi:putative peptide zinc metalloprotease protein
MPWPTSITAPAIVEYTDLSIVRSRVDGFVETIHVNDGQHVKAGELLIELKNDDLQTEMHQLESSVAQAGVLRRSALNEHDAAQAQVALSNQQALLERLAEIRQQCDHLRVFAPVDGRVVARNLRNLIGTYVQEGDELMAVGDEQRKELLVSIAHDQVDDVLPRIGQVTRFRLGSCRLYEGTLTQVEPRASRNLPHPSLSATVGGPLAVSEDSEDEQPGDSRLVEPRFPGVITIAPQTCDRLASGARGYALFGLRDEPAGRYLWNRFRNWLVQLGEIRRK